MDPITRVRDFLLENVGHMTYPGNASFDSTTQRWFVPIYCRTDRGDVVVGDVEVDGEGRMVYAPSREEMIARLGELAAPTSLNGVWERKSDNARALKGGVAHDPEP
jgi:hypothetical protein